MQKFCFGAFETLKKTLKKITPTLNFLAVLYSMCFLDAVYFGFGDSEAFISFVNSYCKGMHRCLVLKFYTILSK